MQIEFLWINRYAVINNQEFNFNPNVRYSFNRETGELKREEQNIISDKFFTNEIDTIDKVSALIGANGAGKSTILEFLAGFLTSSNKLSGLIVTDRFIINKSDGAVQLSPNWIGEKPEILDEFTISNYYRLLDPNLTVEEKKNLKTRQSNRHILGNIVSDTCILYYSGELNTEHTNRVYQNLMSLEDEFSNAWYIDVSDTAMMSKDQQAAGTEAAIYAGVDPVLAYRAGESVRFFNFMKSKLSEHIPFSFDHIWVNIRFSDIDKIFFESYDEIAFKPIADAIERLLDETEIKENKINPQLLTEIRSKGIGGYFEDKLEELEQPNEEEVRKSVLYHKILIKAIRERILQTMGDLTNSDKLGQFARLLEDISRYFSDNNSYQNQIIAYLTKSRRQHFITGKFNFKSLETLSDYFASIAGSNFRSDSWETNGIHTSFGSRQNFEIFLNAITDFTEKSKGKFDVSTIFEINIRGLSTGEKQFLKLFSRLADLPHFNPNVKNNKIKTAIMLLDEFDLGFHPIWQRKYLTELINFLERLIQHSGWPIKFQLILTSHSPFLVSDLPKECLNFLKKGKKSQWSESDNLSRHQPTFGANIHELLSDAFFLEGALIGDFAKRQIDMAFKNLTDKDATLQHKFIQSLIRVVGEPLIKIKLAEMYAERVGANSELAKWRAQQDYINQRIKEIEQNAANQDNNLPKP